MSIKDKIKDCFKKAHLDEHSDKNKYLFQLLVDELSKQPTDTVMEGLLTEAMVLVDDAYDDMHTDEDWLKGFNDLNDKLSKTLKELREENTPKGKYKINSLIDVKPSSTDFMQESKPEPVKVYSHHTCVFNYCPHAHLCQPANGCIIA